MKDLVVPFQSGLVRSLESAVRLREALVYEHDVLGVQLARIAEQTRLAAPRLDVGNELLDLRVGEERLHRRHQRERVHVARVVEVSSLPVIWMPARFLREVG